MHIVPGNVLFQDAVEKTVTDTINLPFSRCVKTGYHDVAQDQLGGSYDGQSNAELIDVVTELFRGDVSTRIVKY